MLADYTLYAAAGFGMRRPCAATMQEANLAVHCTESQNLLEVYH
jgi:hypothetical protein